MGRGIKIALPGYNAFTDTNPDHFSLFVDQDDPLDYVLIKELVSAPISVVSHEVISHNLGYVPFALVFAEVSSGVWRRLYSHDIGSFAPYFTIDDTNLDLYNSGGTRNFAYHIFLDNVTSGNAVFPNQEPHHAVAIAKRGVNAELATDPNDFVFHSDFNTFKIITQATKEITLSASTNDQTFTEAHGQKFIPLVHAFAKESTKAQVFLANSANVDLWGPKLGTTNTGVTFNYVQTDDTYIYFNFSNSNGSSKTVYIRYFVLEKVI